MAILDKFTSDSEEDDQEKQETDKQNTSDNSENDQGSKQVKNKKNILLEPIVSEKTAIKEQENKYTFAVNPEANKIEIKQRIEEIYGVKPDKVNTMNIKGKKKRFRFYEGKQKDIKKAIVTIPESNSINIHEGV
jgi:large subunit ribosomal protein L23